MDKTKLALLTGIHFFGTQEDFANQLGTTQGFISHMVTGRKEVPPKIAVKIEHLTKKKVTREMLRPDDYLEIWPELKRRKNSEREISPKIVLD